MRFFRFNTIPGSLVWLGILGFLAGWMVACLLGCEGPQGSQGKQGEAIEVSINPNLPDAQDPILGDENANRAALGQDLLTYGLTCTLYTVPGSTIAIIGATLATVGSYPYHGAISMVNGPSSQGFPMLPPALQPVYTSFFIQKCTGQLVVDDSNWHTFSLTSDDGANFYLDGSLLINNDGIHGSQTKTGTKYLKYGIHSFQLDYLDVGGNHALLLGEDGETVTTNQIVH